MAFLFRNLAHSLFLSIEGPRHLRGGGFYAGNPHSELRNCCADEASYATADSFTKTGCQETTRLGRNGSATSRLISRLVVARFLLTTVVQSGEYLFGVHLFSRQEEYRANLGKIPVISSVAAVVGLDCFTQGV